MDIPAHTLPENGVRRRLGAAQNDERVGIAEMNGILVLDKPSGKTSHDMVDLVRKSARMKKVGHTGTLDPMATGVLVLLLGRATRVGQFLELEPKEYVAEAVFGLVTDTQDITGAVLSESDGSIERTALEAVLPRFTGEIQQVPPMVSAIKVGGQRLYKLARKGKEIERAARAVTIYELELLEFYEKAGRSRAVLRVVCSGGTYVRTLVHDIGAALGTGATLGALRRARVGAYGLEGALTVDDLGRAGVVEERLIPMDTALRHLPGAIVKSDAESLILNGREIYEADLEATPKQAKPGDIVRLKTAGNRLLALGRVKTEPVDADTTMMRIKPEIVFGLDTKD